MAPPPNTKGAAVEGMQATVERFAPLLRSGGSKSNAVRGKQGYNPSAAVGSNK